VGVCALGPNVELPVCDICVHFVHKDVALLPLFDRKLALSKNPTENEQIITTVIKQNNTTMDNTLVGSLSTMNVEV